MAQPQMARITCVQCNAFYNSERELRDHMHTAHRLAGSEHTSDVRRLAGQPEEYAQVDEEKKYGDL